MFRCGFYESEITPPLGGYIPGYFRRRVADEVKSKLYVKAMAICSDDKEMVIIAVDGISTPQSFCDGIYARLEEFAGLSRDQIMIAATHNHTAGTYRNKNAEFASIDETYTDVLIRKSADCAVLALNRMVEATVYYGCKKAENIAFIRNYRMKDGSIRTNPGRLNPDIIEPIGEVDEDFPFLIFKDSQGNFIGSLSSFALHQDTVAGNAYCGEYSGVLSDELKKVYGSDFVSMFLVGFCGNINHVNTRIAVSEQPKPLYVHIGKTLFGAFQEGVENAKEIENPSIGFARKVLTVEQRKVDPKRLEEAKELMIKSGYDFENLSINDPESEVFKRAEASEIVKYAKTQDVPFYPVVQVMRIGDCMIYAANGECYIEFQHYIKANSPTDKNLFASCSNGAFQGYLPIKEMYEVTTLYEAQIPDAHMVKGTGEKISDELVQMAKELL